MKAVYRFSASGKTPGGVKVRCAGEVIGEDTPPDDNFPPHSIFEAARECVEKQFPGIVLDGDKVVSGMPIKSYPTVSKSKTATKKLQAKSSI